jgi:septum formation protein
VTFRELSDEEIFYYIENYQPLDKAGAYGIQEWIGLRGITRIEGSYYNVVGMPVSELYSHLLQFTGNKSTAI